MGNFGVPAASSSSSSSTPKKYYVYGIVFLLLVGAGVYFMQRSSPPKTTPTPVPIIDTTSLSKKSNPNPISSGKTTVATTTLMNATPVNLDPLTIDNPNTDPPEIKLATFAFEPKERPGMVPDASGKLMKKPAANPPYKLFACNLTSAYAVRWNGMYLSLDSPNKMIWTEDKKEPDSCFKIVPGYCGNAAYIMLRSVMNRMFVRYDETSGALVCKDTPTSRTASKFCWKLVPDTTTKQPCGPQYSYDLGRVIDIPCNLKTTPDAGKSCDTVTPGYQAQCCIAKGPNARSDSFCSGSAWPEVVGRSVQEAVLYLRTRRPEFTLRPCPEPCQLQAYPVPDQRTVVIPYDARTNIVTSPARRLV